MDFSVSFKAHWCSSESKFVWFSTFSTVEAECSAQGSESIVLLLSFKFREPANLRVGDWFCHSSSLMLALRPWRIQSLLVNKESVGGSSANYATGAKLREWAPALWGRYEGDRLRLWLYFRIKSLLAVVLLTMLQEQREWAPALGGRETMTLL